MLDVHPPHGPTHTWKEFFIHLATIVIGLLIAVGIEHVVEKLHQSWELKEARESLDREMESNKVLMANNGRDWVATFARLKNSLIVLQYLQQHPNAPHADLPGKLTWTQFPFIAHKAVWDSLLAKGTIHLMPLNEANRYKEFYAGLDTMSKQSLESWDAINHANRFDLIYPDPSTIPQSLIAGIIDDATKALSKEIELGYSLAWCHETFPDYYQIVTYEKIQRLRPDAADVDKDGMAAAKARTKQRIDETMKLFGLEAQ